jgi:hypothetical protein
VKKSYFGIGYSDFNFLNSKYQHFNQLYIDYEYRYSERWFYNLSVAYEVIRHDFDPMLYNFSQALTFENSINFLLKERVSFGFGLTASLRGVECRGSWCDDQFLSRFFDPSDIPGFLTPFFEASYYTPEYKGFILSFGGRFSTGNVLNVDYTNYGITTKVIYQVK